MSRRMDKEEAAHLQYETEHTEPPKSRSVVVYMAILIAAAFLLLLLAYVMQMRTADSVAGLHQTVNSFQTIDQLVEDNRTLQEEIESLKGEVALLDSARRSQNNDLNTLSGQLEEARAAQAQAESQAEALSALHQLRVLYNGGKYKDAIKLIEDYPDMERDLELVNSKLTDEELDIYDPLAAYQRIAKLLGVE